MLTVETYFPCAFDKRPRHFLDQLVFKMGTELLEKIS